MSVERDPATRLPVIDGPYKGQRVARAGDAFTELHASAANNKGTGARVTYCLRRHSLIGLVWATEANKSVSKP